MSELLVRPAGMRTAAITESLHLLWTFVQRELRIRYRQTALGVGWTLLQPLLTVVVWSVVFGAVIRVPSARAPYALFALSGLLLWLFTSMAVAGCTTVIVGNAQLVSRNQFPRLLLPAAHVLARVPDFVLGVLALLGLSLLMGQRVPALFIPAAALALAGCTLLCIGLGSMLAALNVRYRDVQVVVPFALQIWLFLTPVFYPPSLLPPWYRRLLAFNPVAGMIEGMRSAYLAAPVDWQLFQQAMLVCALVFAAGIALFSRLDPDLVDHV